VVDTVERVVIGGEVGFLICLRGLVIEALGEVEVLLDVDTVSVYSAKISEGLCALMCLCCCLVTCSSFLHVTPNVVSAKVVIAHLDHRIDVRLFD